MSIGANILAQFVRDQAKLLNFIEQSKPSAVVVMDGTATAQSIRQRSPSTLVIHRAYNPNDKNWHDRKADGSWVFPPTQWLNDHQGAASNGVTLQVFNEPSPINLDKFIDWLIELMAVARARGITLVVANFAVGNPYEKDIQAGKFDRLIRAIVQYGHILGLHEYFVSDPVAEAPWLCNRVEYWLDRAALLGVKLRVVITEHGRDLGGGKNDGYHGQGWSGATYFIKLKAAQVFYEARGIPVCVFCWGYGANDDWASFDFESDDELQRLIVQYNQEHSVSVGYPALPSVGDSRWKAGTITSKFGTTNVRSTPVIADNNVVGSFGGSVPASIIMDAALAVPAGPRAWRPVKFSTSGIIGWVRDDVFTFEDAQIVIPAEKLIPAKLLVGVRLRDQPTTQLANILVDVPAGAQVKYALPDKVVNVDGYDWAFVVYGAYMGWMALVRSSWSQQFEVASTNRKAIDVPYASQWGWPSKRTGMCGPASGWMIVADDKRWRLVKMPVEITVDSMADYLGLGASSFTKLKDLAKALNAYGVNAVWTGSLTVDKVTAEIDAGYPVICMGQYSHLSNRSDQKFGGGHILVAVGYSDTTIICNDPDYSGTAGRQVEYSKTEFAKFLNDTAASGNSPDQGLIIRYWGFPQLP